MNHRSENDVVVVLDIEGTIVPISFVKDVLFPFAKQHVTEFLRRESERAEVRADIIGIAKHGGVSPDDLDAVIETIDHLISSDVKQTDLKSLQGKIWRDGYERGELVAPFFDDVPSYLERCTPLYIYSSGSIAAQKLLFAHSNAGDLSSTVDDYFDTTSGQKTSVSSYQNIAKTIGSGTYWFGSDHPGELRAASDAGWNVAHFVRPGNPDSESEFVRVENMTEFERLTNT